MADELTFMMGKYEARIPTDRLYAENHHWLMEGPGGFRVGLTAYAVRLLQDVYFLDWSIDPFTKVRKKQSIGQIESSKAVSDLFSPVDGEVREFNPGVLHDPSAINTDGYGGGWLYDFQTDMKLLTPAEYLRVLEQGWEKTQRMIKGQMNE
jgi:glycine cleavage system H protein